MKRLILTSAMALMLAMGANAQKLGYVDTDYILEQLPQFAAAQEELDKISEQWQAEIEGMYAEVEQLYQDYQNNRAVLTEQMRRQREDEIITKENEVKQRQNEYFGPEGALFEKRQELVKPIQDRVFNAIQEVAQEGQFDIILDKAAGATLIFTSERYDRSQAVLDKLR